MARELIIGGDSKVSDLTAKILNNTEGCYHMVIKKRSKFLKPGLMLGSGFVFYYIFGAASLALVVGVCALAGALHIALKGD